MTPDQSAAYIFSQSACMLVEMEAMKAANTQSAAGGFAVPVYKETDFRALIDNWCVHHNGAVTVLNGAT